MKERKIENIRSSESSFDMNELRKELLEENNFLTKLVDTIPAKMYFEHDIQEKLTAAKHLAMDKAAEAIKRKSSNHIKLSAKAKHKRARLDPLQQKSVSQIHEELSKKKERKREKKQKNLLAASASLTRAANIEELQKRLQERIAQLQGQRKAFDGDSKTKKRLKEKMKKLKRKGNKLKAQELPQAEKTPKITKPGSSDAKPVFNKESNLIFSKFNFSEEDGQDDKMKNEYAGKKTKNLLKKAEMKREKIDKLKDTDPEKAKVVLEKDKWKKAIMKSEGIKVKDDPTLLKKSLKHDEKRKKKSAKVWKGRIDDTEKRKKARQDKRNRNIKQKKKEKFDRKIKLAKKKGRVIPGF